MDQRGVVHVLEAVTGYVDNLKPITDVGFSGSIQCFLGNSIHQTSANPNPTQAAENSLTLWGDKGDSEIVCDYGAAESFMHYLAGRLGPGFCPRSIVTRTTGSRPFASSPPAQASTRREPSATGRR